MNYCSVGIIALPSNCNSLAKTYSCTFFAYAKQDYNAKLSDFGLAKDGPVGDKSHVSTRIMGTYGYAAPEYILTGKSYHKLRHFFSFGIRKVFANQIETKSFHFVPHNIQRQCFTVKHGI